MLRKLLMNRLVRIALVCLFGLALAAAVVAWKTGVDFEALKEMWKQVNDYLVRHPSTLFWALVFLPGLPIPTSALLFTAGVVWRQQPLMACLLCLLAMLLNLTWTYWLAAGPARRLVEKLLMATAVQIPDLPQGNHLKLILVLKLTPGIPFFFQNYLLGFLRAPFYLYLSISMLGNGIIGTGIVLSGAGLADGKLMPAITGVSLIAVGAVLTQMIRSWLARRRRVDPVD
ncbi:MAG: VTT domain-containing protein [Armatimonadetes bacterium]|nr:VTT domain-containing protein [Akkermansiaceae bacterium]